MLDSISYEVKYPRSWRWTLWRTREHVMAAKDSEARYGAVAVGPEIG